MSNIINITDRNERKRRNIWTVNYITSQGVYTDHNAEEPSDGEDVRKHYESRTAYIGKHSGPGSFRSINFDIGD